MKESLPAVPSLLAVCAHPDDESFGLGGILGAFADAGTRCAVLCFTHGEASTLGADEGHLAEIRPRELAEAAEVLGVSAVELLDYPDGGLAEQPPGDLTAHAVRVAAGVGSRMFLVFDGGGITGHPDHVRATEAALVAADAIGGRVLAWAIPDRVARALNAEFGATFVGRSEDEIDIAIRVDRARQRRAMECHRSQALNTPVPWRRLELTGEVEWLRYLRR